MLTNNNKLKFLTINALDLQTAKIVICVCIIHV